MIRRPRRPAARDLYGQQQEPATESTACCNEHRQSVNDKYLQTQKKNIERSLFSDKLRWAMNLKDRVFLEKLIDECQASNVLDEHDVELQNAKLALQGLHAAEDMRRACTERHGSAAERHIKQLETDGLADYLRLDIIKAQREINTLNETPRSRPPSMLRMSRETVSEIKRYTTPPGGIHEIMKAALLLLNESEDRTADWKAVQAMCHPSGALSLYQRVVSLDITRVNAQLAARAKQILDSIDVDKLQTYSAAALTFYVWARDIANRVTRGKAVKPADIDRQRVLIEQARLAEEYCTSLRKKHRLRSTYFYTI